ncbi:MAG: magnesium transporter MgtE N-terminal domain-containing protein [Thermomicrobiales bacterium]
MASKMPNSAPAATELYLSRVLGKPVSDAQGARLARIEDLVVRVDGDPNPPVSGLIARQGRRDFYVDWQRIAELSEAGARLSTFKVDLRPFARQEGEALLRRDILDKQLIDIDGRRVVRANDLLLARTGAAVRLVGVDVSIQGIWRRLAPERVAAGATGRRLIEWADVESFATDVPMIRLRSSHEKVARLHPVDIAQLLDDLSPVHSREILESLDDETAADAVQELDPDDAADLLESMDPERAADILDDMAPDDAADVLAEMGSDDSEQLLGLMEPDESEDVRELLALAKDHTGHVAASLMTTDIVTLDPSLTTAEVIATLRELPDPPDPLFHLYLVEIDPVDDERQRLAGVVSLRNLVLAAPSTHIADLADREAPRVTLDTPTREVAQIMAEYNLATIPVVDNDGCILGAIHVDDAMDVILPELWARRFTGRLFH